MDEDVLKETIEKVGYILHSKRILTDTLMGNSFTDDLLNQGYTKGYNKALDDFRKKINDFLIDTDYFADFVVKDSAIDCVIDKLKKGIK